MNAGTRIGLFAVAAAATFGVSYAAGQAVDPVGLSESEPAAEHTDPTGWSDHGSHMDAEP